MGTDLTAVFRGREVESAGAFRLRLLAEELTLRRPQSDFDAMESLDSSRDTILYPHQIHAAHFATSNPMLRGVLFADEVGLGKTIEAAMVVKEAVYRGARNVLVVAGKSLCQQWAAELRDRFALEVEVLDSAAARAMERGGRDPYSGLRVCTYHFVNGHLGELAKTTWDLVVVDECHLLKNPQGALHRSVKRLPRRFTVLLTATPIQNYLPELHSVSTLIDELALGTPFSFRERYCADPRGLTVQNVHELRERLSRFGIRTLRSDVPEIEWTARHPRLFNFDLFDDERELYEGVSDYLSRPNWAFGDNAAGKYLIVLVYRKLLASSSFALRGALRKVLERLQDMAKGIETAPLQVADLGGEAVAVAREILEEGDAEAGEADRGVLGRIEDEIEETRGYVELCERIQENAKGVKLVEVIPSLLEQGDRVLVFTQYKATQAYLARKLEAAGYRVQRFSGDLKSHRNPDKDERELAKRRFEQEADVMIATDAGAEGINLQFCHLVVNYDLPWNPMKIEQRIGRCHRLGQKHDVVVANLVATGNAVDARLVQLLTDKIHLFDSVLGESDEILGALEDGMDFERAVFEILQTCRTPEQIDAAFEELQRNMERVIAERRSRGKSLLQGFDDRIRDHLRFAEERARAALSHRQQQLRDFIVGAVEAHGGRVWETNGIHDFSVPAQLFLHSSDLLDPDYRGTFHKGDDAAVTYFTKRHPLVQAALDYHRQHGARAALTLAYTGNHNIHGMDRFVGCEGWWLTFKVCLSGLEVEDHLLPVVLIAEDRELWHDDLLTEAVPRLTVQEGTWDESLPIPTGQLVESILLPRIKQLTDGILERNAEYYLERREVLDRYYGAKGDGEVLAELRHRVRDKMDQMAALDDQIEATKPMTTKVDLMRQQDALNDELFELQQRMQTEQMGSFAAKRKAVAELEQLRELRHEVELVSVAQWRLV
jgi:superfamily II DNA or RNA helicase